MKLQVKKNVLFAVGMIALSFTSCVKNDIDDPPANGVDPAIAANTTIAHLKSLFTGNIITIDSDFVVKGVVVGDDHSGNLYKSLVIQDATGGINIQLDQSSYYTTYKVGRNVFVKCKGLVLGDYNELVQLGGYIDNSSGTPSVGRIPQSLVPVHLIAGMWNQPYQTKVVNNFDSLDYTSDQNKLVRLEGVHFVTPCQSWADLQGQTSGNRDLKDAFNNTFIVRTSNFATFAAGLIPDGTGTVIGIFQVYSGDKQLVIRELVDVQFASPCIPPTPVGTGALMTIDSIRPLFTSPTTFVNGTKVRGVVISDKANNNITNRNIVFQCGAAGIVVRFKDPNTYSLNDSIEINLSGDSLTMFNGLLQINNVDNASATMLGTGSVTPRTATIAQISSAGTNWESTLVTILNVTSLTGGTSGTWGGTVILNDGTGTIDLYTRTGGSGATFQGSTYPSSAASITGYINTYNGASELNIRNLSDIQ